MQDIQFRPLTAAWTEGLVTWDKRTIADNWSIPGGDFGASVASIPFANLTVGEWIEVGIPASVVQAWIDDPSSNYGLMVRPELDGSPPSYLTHTIAGFASSENAAVGNRPELVIDYAGSGNLNPQVSLTMDDTTVVPGAPVQLAAIAADVDGSVTNVEFYVDGGRVGSDSSDPYQATTVFGQGSYVVTAIAYDDDGGSAVSDPVVVTALHVLYEALMDDDPGWTFSGGQWAYGQPTGASCPAGSPDPSSGYTGNRVVGYNLDGPYEHPLSARYAMTPSFNCTGFTNVHLTCRIWLGVRFNFYTWAKVQVSTNGSTWTDVWVNSSFAARNGGSWEHWDLDISSLADGQPTVYVRWQMGPTDNWYWAYSGWNIDDVRVVGETPLPSLGVDLDDASISENAGSTSGTVTRLESHGDLVVTLWSDDVTEAVVTNVTIPDGQRSTRFVVTGVPDGLRDDDQRVAITASADGYTPGQAILTISNVDTGSLSVIIEAASISEQGGWSTATVSRANCDTRESLRVTLSSDRPDEATVTGAVEIAVGEASVGFVVTAVDDAVMDGSQIVTVTASAVDCTDGRDTIEIADDDEPHLLLGIDETAISEDGGSSRATVTRYHSTGALTVHLLSDDPTEATVPSSVVISNGRDSAVFTVTAVDDALDDGRQTATITATAVDHLSAQDTLTVLDDEFLGKKMKVTFSGYDKSETLTNFPALVKLGEALEGFLYSDFASTNGWDLRFTDEAEDAPLNHEIEVWNVNGTSYVWVQVPELRNGTSIWASWGDTELAGTQAAYATNGATWSADYAGVWHMTETDAQDSTAYGNHGTAGGPNGVGLVGGYIGNGCEFYGETTAGAQSYISIPGNGSLKMGSDFTFSAWVKWGRSGLEGWGRVVDKKTAWNGPNGWHVTRENTHATKLELRASGGSAYEPTGVATWADQQWVKLDVIYNGTTVSVYRDGRLHGSGSIGAVSDADDALVLGNNAGLDEWNWDGLIDEARCSEALRSPDWIWAGYSNQVAGSTFCTYGAVESGGESVPVTTYGTPHSWLAAHGITNNYQAADIADLDGDGALTWQEYLAGTDPMDGSSVFRVFETHFQNGSNGVSWYGTTNSGVMTGFIIYRTTNLLDPAWLPVGTNTRSATGTNIWWDNSQPAGMPLFYRPALQKRDGR